MSIEEVVSIPEDQRVGTIVKQLQAAGLTPDEILLFFFGDENEATRD